MKTAPILTLIILAPQALHAQWQSFPRADLLLGNRQTLENSISGASGIAIDEAHHKIYVSCEQTNRVVRFDTQAVLNGGLLAPVEAVFGQSDAFSESSGRSDSTLYKPSALAVDPAGTLWISDRNNRRILRYDQAHTKQTGARANGVLGSPLFTTVTTQFSADVMGLAVDSSGNLFVSDGGHHCVYRFNQAAWRANGSPPDAVLGQPDMTTTTFGLSAVKMHNPRGIFTTSGLSTTLWVVDQTNNRVLRFDNANTAPNGAAAASVLGQPDMTTGSSGNAMSRFKNPLDVAVIGTNLIVSDPGNYRTLRFSSASPVVNSSATAEMRIFTNGVSAGPERLALEPLAGRLWGARQNLITWFSSPASGSGVVYRTQVFGSEDQTLWNPRDVAIDPVSGKVFVAECGPTPLGVARYASYGALVSGALPEAWVCRRQSLANLSVGGGLYAPHGLSVDPQGRLWVADPVSRAVYRYNNAATMGAYTSESGYLGGASGSGANQMLAPVDVYADPQGRVWVVDSDNHRVLRFDNAASKANGAPANGVLGQAGFGSAAQGSPPNAWNLNNPKGITGDGAGNIWVADTGNNRVLRYNNAAAKVNGAAINGVIGQINSTSSTPDLGEGGMDHPMQLAWEASGHTGGHLWVSEAGNHRMLRFKNALTSSDGAAADNLIGQPDFWHNDSRQDLNHAMDPCGMAVDPQGRLWVADAGGDRIMRFSPGELVVKSCGITGQNKFQLIYSSVAGAQYDIEGSGDLQYWSFEGTQSAGSALTTWITSQSVSGRRFYRVKAR